MPEGDKVDEREIKDELDREKLKDGRSKRRARELDEEFLRRKRKTLLWVAVIGLFYALIFGWRD
jgi:hypothetical protein